MPSKEAILLKILALEGERGYGDDAVVGGLDRFLQKWRHLMATYVDEPPLGGGRYGSLSRDERREWAAAVARGRLRDGNRDLSCQTRVPRKGHRPAFTPKGCVLQAP